MGLGRLGVKITVIQITQTLFKVVRNNFPFSIPTELYERLTRLL